MPEFPGPNTEEGQSKGPSIYDDLAGERAEAMGMDAKMVRARSTREDGFPEIAAVFEAEAMEAAEAARVAHDESEKDAAVRYRAYVELGQEGLDRYRANPNVQIQQLGIGSEDDPESLRYREWLYSELGVTDARMVAEPQYEHQTKLPLPEGRTHVTPGTAYIMPTDEGIVIESWHKGINDSDYYTITMTRPEVKQPAA